MSESYGLASVMRRFSSATQANFLSRQARLSSVVFQHQLGSLHDKTERITQLASEIAFTFGADQGTTTRAAQLCKCDLVSEMVLEFPDLQGAAGRQYATHDGETAEVAEAIESHYYPRFAGDHLPPSAEASAVALQPLIRLSGFLVSASPPGFKRPFRATPGIVSSSRILIDQEGGIITCASRPSGVTHSAALQPDTVEVVQQYILDRLGNWYDDEGIHSPFFARCSPPGSTTSSTSTSV